jgi:hypothetical protein
MRTADPQNIKKDFITGLNDVEGVLQGVANVTLPLTSRNLVAEYTFLGASILLEGFISDLFVAYINKKNAPFVAALTKNMVITSTDENAKRAISFAAVDIASHLTLDKIRSVLDPRDFNVTFHATSDMKAKAGTWLDDPYKDYFRNLSTSHCSTLEATKSVRNYLAHRSKASLTTMQAALVDSNLPPGFRSGANKVRSVGSFLESRPPVSLQRRIEFFVCELRAIATVLCP